MPYRKYGIRIRQYYAIPLTGLGGDPVGIVHTLRELFAQNLCCSRTAHVALVSQPGRDRPGPPLRLSLSATLRGSAVNQTIVRGIPHPALPPFPVFRVIVFQ